MTTANQKIIVGIFDHSDQAHQAVDELQLTGFRDAELELIGGAVAGGLLGQLKGMGIGDDFAVEVEQSLLSGGALVSLYAEGRQDEAVAILAHNGAKDVAMPTDDDMENVNDVNSAEDVPHLGLWPEHLS